MISIWKWSYADSIITAWTPKMIISISNVHMSSGWMPSFTRNLSNTGELSSVVKLFSPWDFRTRSLPWAWRTYFPMTLSKTHSQKRFPKTIQARSTYLSSTSQASKSFLANGVKKNRHTWKPVSQRHRYLCAVTRALIILVASDDEL